MILAKLKKIINKLLIVIFSVLTSIPPWPISIKLGVKYKKSLNTRLVAKYDKVNGSWKTGNGTPPV